MARFDTMDSDCLILDYLILHPKWRGLKLGLLAVRKVVDMLGGGCGLTVADFWPLRQDAHEQLRVPASWIPALETRKERKVALFKLRRHFWQMGFTQIGRTPRFGLSMAQRVPIGREGRSLGKQLNMEGYRRGW